MATGGIPRSTSQYADIIIGGNFPQFDETTYAARAAEQLANSQQMADGAATVTNMAGTVDANMQGLTADASAERSAERTAAMTAKQTMLANRALGVAAMGQNIANAKSAQNGNLAAFELVWNEAQRDLVASGADQQTLTATYDTLVDEFKGQADSLGANFQQADAALKEQVKSGVEPTIPPSFATAAPGDSPSLNLPPELMNQMQSMLGQGMSAAQSLPQSLQGAVSPLTQQAQGLIDPLMQAIQGAGDGSGNVNVTPDMLDEMLSSQESSGSGSGGGGAEAPASDTVFVGENTDAKDAEEKPESEDAGDKEPAAQDESEDDKPAAPSPAASPVTQVSAPPESAKMPETVLSSDDALDVLFG